MVVLSNAIIMSWQWWIVVDNIDSLIQIGVITDKTERFYRAPRRTPCLRGYVIKSLYNGYNYVYNEDQLQKTLKRNGGSCSE